jgi:putative hydrolase of the HAD superfamily
MSNESPRIERPSKSPVVSEDVRCIPDFLYFDLGNVLLHFDHQRAARQMAEVAGITPERVWQIVFAGELELRYERGELTTGEFYEAFCTAAGTRPEFSRLCRAAAEIFELNTSLVPVVAHLAAAGYRIGILSNTNELHWDYAYSGRYSCLRRYFKTFALSFELRKMKPEPAIYSAAAELADTEPARIFFVDDRPDNVAGAKAAGFDAILFESASQTARALRHRGIRLNY